MSTLSVQKSRVCERCKALVPLEGVKLFAETSDRSVVVCENCSVELENAKKGKLERTGTTKRFNAPAKNASYTCERCTYKFRVDEARAGIVHRVFCPYCGKDDKLIKL
ncbi:MAG: hypothetical protein HYS32_03125 [Candidatus Woesearchaeota archaeon]|nr:MAG: hypothetical protein HYS32_03125 [Candidatus Woesearchaeota archaeon]